MKELIYLWDGKAPYSEFSPDGFQPTLCPYTVDGSQGAVIVLAGGGYFKKSDYEAYPVAEKIAGFGISAFVLDYRIKPCHKLAPLADVNRAVKKLRALGYKKVAVLGFSAGGNAACCGAVHWDRGIPDSPDPVERFSSRPDAFVACYAVVSFVGYTHMGSVISLLGDEYGSIEQQRFFSAELNVTDETPEAFIWHCADDTAVPVECCLKLCLALSGHSVPYEVHIFPEGGHGLGLAEGHADVCRWPDMLKNFLIRRGYNLHE